MIKMLKEDKTIPDKLTTIAAAALAAIVVTCGALFPCIFGGLIEYWISCALN